ncbi:MAG: hypothetical protein WBB74_12530 [Gaiellaceae bacterium]
MNVPDHEAHPVDVTRPSESVAGLLAASAIAAELVGIVYRPVRVTLPALAVALLATAMGGRHQRLAAFAVGLGAVAFWLGMAIAVLKDRPLF